MKERNTLLSIAQDIEACSRKLKVYTHENLVQEETAERETMAYAGTMLSMASSVLCELYSNTKPDFSVAAVNGVLREWGVDELV